MDSRREFIKKASVLSGAAGAFSVFPASILKALAIEPQAGSTYLDAEHVVVLMQENRSFDHCYGTLKGIRGFNDPRAITLADKNPVWLQTNAAGETYAPFRLRIKETKSTWLGSLPHSWTNQVDAGNGGKHDKWLDAKPSGRKGYGSLPLTMGYYNREDIPFYYAMADAFTVCDQNFSSSLTGTTPNRLFLWTGTVRAEQNSASAAKVRNEDVNYDREVKWKTFPERLEENGISWKIYQNEISLPTGLEGEEDAWLSNFTDNPIEWFSQYHVRFSEKHIQFLEKLATELPNEIIALEKKIASLPEGEDQKTQTALLKKKQDLLIRVKKDRTVYTKENFEKLSAKEKSIHAKAFSTNKNDPDYRKLKTVNYDDGKQKRQVKVPAGDILHQFRTDVKNGELPTVSWIVSPENFSDHPGAPWYGAWYISEVMDILTQNPEVWKKTIFILCYDENDGYYDHVPPPVPPNPNVPASGKVSEGIDPAIEFVTFEQDKIGRLEKNARESPVGLGYRVPLVIASPWSRGGTVCSQVFDHTSILQFMEKFLSHKTGKKIEESNISAWRRAVCGDLTSVFKPYHGEKIALPEFPGKDTFIEGIHQAQFQKDPFGYHKLTKEEIGQIIRDPALSPLMTRQEKGTRASCALPYELYADGKLVAGSKFELSFKAGNEVFGQKSAGACFLVYDHLRNRSSYTVKAGDRISDLIDFDKDYRFDLYGPNGFFRSFKGESGQAGIETVLTYDRKPDGKKLSGNISFNIINNDPKQSYVINVKDNSYRRATISKRIAPAGTAGSSIQLRLDLSSSSAWYDYSINIEGLTGFERTYAGRVETGAEGISDPAMA